MRFEDVGARVGLDGAAAYEIYKHHMLFGSIAPVIAGLLDPVGRDAPEGRHVRFDNSDTPACQLKAPIAPGVIETIGIESWNALLPDKPVPIELTEGSIAFDGERELSFSAADRPTTSKTSCGRTVPGPCCSGRRPCSTGASSIT